MTSRLLLLCAGAAAVMLACGPRPHSGESSSTPDAAAAAAAVNDSGPLASSLNVKVDDGVQLVFHVTNTSGRNLELVFPSGQTHDFAIEDSLGRVLWRWSDGRMFTQAIQTKLLVNGETISYEERWEHPPAHGTLIAVATLRSEGHPVSQRLEFSLGR